MTKTLNQTIATRTVRSIAVAVTLFGALTMLSTESHAFSAEAQQMCTADAFKLCSAEIPNIPKITACMVKNRTNLSTGCRAVMDKEAAASRRSQTASIQ